MLATLLCMLLLRMPLELELSISVAPSRLKNPLTTKNKEKAEKRLQAGQRNKHIALSHKMTLLERLLQSALLLPFALMVMEEMETMVELEAARTEHIHL